MFRKWTAILLGVVGFNVFFLYLGTPQVGTLGFVILINLILACMFLAHSTKVIYVRHAYASSTAMLAILSAVLSIFRASSFSVIMLSLTSLVLCLITLYMLTLVQGSIHSFSEILLIPVRITVAWVMTWVQLIFGQVIKVGSTVTESVETIDSLEFQQSRFGKLFQDKIIVAAMSIFVILALVLTFPVWSMALVNLVKGSSIHVNLSPLSSNRRIFESVLLIIGLVPFAFLKIDNRSSLHIPNDFFQLMQWELFIGLSAVISGLGGWILWQWYKIIYQIGGNWNGLFGISEMASWRSTLTELLVIIMAIYFIVLVGTQILEVIQEEAPLRGLLIFLVTLGMIYLLGLGVRFWLYVHTLGLSLWCYYTFSLSLMGLVLFCVCLARLGKGMSRKWQILEIGVILCFVFGVNIINVERMMVSDFPPKKNGAVDYNKMAELSSDGVLGWYDSFVYARTELERLRIKENTTGQIDPAKVEEVMMITRTVRENYWQLAKEYGTKDQIKVLSEINYEGPLDNDTEIRIWMRLNLSKVNAFRVLSNLIPPEEVARVHESAKEVAKAY